jgi:hypothetical protein
MSINLDNISPLVVKPLRAQRLRWYKESIPEYHPGDFDPDEPTELRDGNAEPDDYNLLSSLDEDGLHQPQLDLDLGPLWEANVRPSSTPGHYHISWEGLQLSWEDYSEVLQVLAKHNMIDAAWVNHSLRRNMTLLRAPHVKKEYAGRDDLLPTATQPLATIDTLCKSEV